MILISQDGLKAISASKIDFLVIQENSRGKFRLLAKTPKSDGFYEFLILFEHENIEVVKHVMWFLAGDRILITHDAADTNILVVDLPDLYAHGMKEIAPELLTAERTREQESQTNFQQAEYFAE